MTLETIELGDNLRVRIEQDTDVEMPSDDIFKIAYSSSRETLGDRNVTRAELDSISEGIRSGALIGWPVYAYVHSGATIRMADANPFHCPWDSGQSGFVYATKDDVLQEIVGAKRMTAKAREKAMAYAKGVVETFDQWLTGDVYGYIVERTRTNEDGDVQVEKTLDSCWGLFGADYAKEAAREAGQHFAS